MEKKSCTLKSPIRCSAVNLLGEEVMVCCFISVVALPSFSYDGNRYAIRGRLYIPDFLKDSRSMYLPDDIYSVQSQYLLKWLLREKPFPTRLVSDQLVFSCSPTVCKEALANTALPFLG